MKLHTILGAGGAVGNQLLPVLQRNNERLRLVSRNPDPLSTAETVAADITNYEQTLNAVKGSDVVYLVVGLAYDIRVWKESWPKIMTNVINACKETGSELIFFEILKLKEKGIGFLTKEKVLNH